MTAREVNFDGLPGLTHHYAGLSFGNEASTRHRYRVSNPQLAAKQGLKKMKALADAGYPQAVIPPQEHAGVWEYLNELLAGDNPIADLRVFDLRESMANGGGPACLRLRVVLTAEEYQAVNPHVLMNDTLFATLNDWVDRYYRDRLTQADLADPQLLREGRDALDRLTQILQLGSVYPFQQ